MKERQWQDWTNILLGIWLVLAPLSGIGHVGDLAAINSYLTGSAVLIFAFAAISRANIWKEYTNMGLGLWLVVAPFVLGFTTLAVPMYNQVITGILISGIAIAAVIKQTPSSSGHGHGHA